MRRIQLCHIQGAEGTVASSPFVIQEPKQYRDTWNQVFGNSRPFEVEVGMGKGHFIMGKTSANSGINYIGVERYSSVLPRGLQRRSRVDLGNVYFMCIDTRDIIETFAPDEAGRVYLNFPDPWPEDHHAKRRLISPVFMSVHDKILAPWGVTEFKTDSRGFFECSMESTPSVGWEITEYISDLHNSIMAEGSVMIEHEMKPASGDKLIYKLITQRTGIYSQDPVQDIGKGYYQEADSMASPPGITRELFQATSGKTDLNRQVPRFNRSFKEAGKLLGSGSAKVKKDKNRKRRPREDVSVQSPAPEDIGGCGHRDSEKDSRQKSHETPNEKFSYRTLS